MALATPTWSQPNAAPEVEASAVRALVAAVGNRAGPPAAEAFYRAPDIEAATLSPSGRWLAMTTAYGSDRVRLAIFDLQEWKISAVAARFSDADLGQVRWVNDEQLVFSVEDRSRGGGDQRWWPGLWAVRRDGTDLRQLVKVDFEFLTRAPGPGREPLPYNHTLLHVPLSASGIGTDVIVGEWNFNGARELTHINAKRLDVLTGRSVSLARGVPDNVMAWWFDAAGEPRLVQTLQGARSAYHWRDSPTTSWRVLVEFDRFFAPFSARFIDAAGALYVSVPGANAEGTHELRRFDFTKGQPEADAVVSTPGFDFTGALVSETPGGRALGVRVVTDAQTTVWFDKRLQALQAQADERLPGRVNLIACRRCDDADMTAVVHSSSDRNPGQIWVYREQGKSWRKVGDVRLDVDASRMALTDFARVRMRDGLEIPVWVTRPAEPANTPANVAADAQTHAPAGKAKPLRPAVLLVHGGPWVRGRYWNWNSDAQFLASRGYVVIEPEFRGSTGYGERLFRAGWRQWGRAMQDDLADALAWAVAQGGVDKNKVCIAGASYGGYATLMGLVKHPELYRCAVAWVAATDPRLMFQWRYRSDQPDTVRAHDYPTLIGDPVADAAMLDSVTPVLLAKQMKSPLLLAVGGQDRRVLPEHGRKMRQALIDAGREPEYVEYADEGHGFFKLANQVDFMRRMEAFLARHLK